MKRWRFMNAMALKSQNCTGAQVRTIKVDDKVYRSEHKSAASSNQQIGWKLLQTHELLCFWKVKACESMRNRVNAFLVQDERALLNHTDKFNIKSSKILDEIMAVVTTRTPKINWVKPTVVGAAIRDLSKAFKFRFHYENMKQWFRCELFYSDTESHNYAVDCDDLHEELARAEVNDFSDYPSDNALYNTENHMVILKFQDELAGVIKEEFCGLKSKMYSTQVKGMCNIVSY